MTLHLITKQKNEMEKQPQGAGAEIQDFGFLTFKGHHIDLMKGPEKHQVDIEDIAHHLALQCRFGGACKHHYSVAEHSILCARHAIPMYSVYFLLHDADEYLLQDMTGPMKRMIFGMDYKNNPHYKNIFNRIDRQILEALGLSEIAFLNLYKDIKAVDNKMYTLEKKFLFGNYPVPEFPEDDPLHGAIFGMTPQEAEIAFIHEYQRLMQ
jgi:uncharacterized protein